MPISLILTDDHPFVLKGLEQFFATEPDFTILASCTDGEETLQAVREHQPDILVLDIQMPHMNGLMVLRELRKDKQPVKVVILTGAVDQDEVFEAVRLGARGVVLKEMAPHFLSQCLRKVHKGETWLEKRSTGRALEKILRHEAGMEQISRVLTPREIELVRLVASGLDNAEIAAKLHISENTVKVHLHRIYGKLAVKSRLALTLYAQEMGLV
jgi:DNA-binding NarL/FixJ family response regulator